MSADFWAGYISGAFGILIGNPLDILKVRLQAGNLDTASRSPNTRGPAPARISYSAQFSTASALIRGASAPILGYGALNALIFVTYNRSSSLLTYGTFNPPPTTSLSAQQIPSLLTTFIAGTLGGLASWVISTPTELIKCRAQVSSSHSTTAASPSSSWAITKSILRHEGIKGLYFGGTVTVLRDSIGYGFYFWSYELTSRYMDAFTKDVGSGGEAAKVLLCGGLAGVITWASVFPLDVIKTRVQTQPLAFPAAMLARAPLLGPNVSSLADAGGGKKGAIEIARLAYRNEGMGVFFRGLGVCSLRAFIVNAAQWAVYEWLMRELDPNRKKITGRGEAVGDLA